jgi:hypothetical protein
MAHEQSYEQQQPIVGDLVKQNIDDEVNAALDQDTEEEEFDNEEEADEKTENEDEEEEEAEP